MFGTKVLSQAVLPVLLVASSGCVFRDIPSHGGGKRFDEEQRMVAKAIRQAVADMDLSELHGQSASGSLRDESAQTT